MSVLSRHRLTLTLFLALVCGACTRARDALPHPKELEPSGPIPADPQEDRGWLISNEIGEYKFSHVDSLMNPLLLPPEVESRAGSYTNGKIGTGVLVAKEPEGKRAWPVFDGLVFSWGICQEKGDQYKILRKRGGAIHAIRSEKPREMMILWESLNGFFVILVTTGTTESVPEPVLNAYLEKYPPLPARKNKVEQAMKDSSTPRSQSK